MEQGDGHGRRSRLEGDDDRLVGRQARRLRQHDPWLCDSGSEPPDWTLKPAVRHLSWRGQEGQECEVVLDLRKKKAMPILGAGLVESSQQYNSI